MRKTCWISPVRSAKRRKVARSPGYASLEKSSSCTSTAFPWTTRRPRRNWQLRAFPGTLRASIWWAWCSTSAKTCSRDTMSTTRESTPWSGTISTIAQWLSSAWKPRGSASRRKWKVKTRLTSCSISESSEARLFLFVKSLLNQRVVSIFGPEIELAVLILSYLSVSSRRSFVSLVFRKWTMSFIVCL